MTTLYIIVVSTYIKYVFYAVLDIYLPINSSMRTLKVKEHEGSVMIFVVITFGGLVDTCRSQYSGLGDTDLTGWVKVLKSTFTPLKSI